MALPVYAFAKDWRNKSYDVAKSRLATIQASDWRLAIEEWMERKLNGSTNHNEWC